LIRGELDQKQLLNMITITERYLAPWLHALDQPEKNARYVLVALAQPHYLFELESGAACRRLLLSLVGGCSSSPRDRYQSTANAADMPHVLHSGCGVVGLDQEGFLRCVAS
jgi:hypothetical protein